MRVFLVRGVLVGAFVGLRDFLGAAGSLTVQARFEEDVDLVDEQELDVEEESEGEGEGELEDEGEPEDEEVEEVERLRGDQADAALRLREHNGLEGSYSGSDTSPSSSSSSSESTSA